MRKKHAGSHGGSQIRVIKFIKCLFAHFHMSVRIEWKLNSVCICSADALSYNMTRICLFSTWEDYIKL